VLQVVEFARPLQAENIQVNGGMTARTAARSIELYAHFTHQAVILLVVLTDDGLELIR